ncbi:Mannan endo-1,4-beta-mannosidase protein, partial [Dioscorea alata]
NGVLYPTLGLVFCVTVIYMSSKDNFFQIVVNSQMSSFVMRNGTQFMVDGKPFYVNGWNSYWLMDHAVEDSSRPRIKAMFQAGAKMGLTVCRAWAFNDGTHNALQVSLSHFDERVFKALDYVIMEAGRYKIKLLLSLVNNLEAYGGKPQYVKWAIKDGISLNSSEDSFFFDPVLRSYFKIYLKTVITRKNHLTGIKYRDDPTIFAWELMNEPRCISDPTGDTLQKWIEEMAGYIKTVDKNHLVTVGLEGFYGPRNTPEKLTINPSKWYDTTGTDFIRNSKTPAIDFASVHIYADQWLIGAELEEKMRYINKWIISHIEDGNKELKKPVLLTEFGLSDKNKDFDHSHRDKLYKSIFDIMYKSAIENGAGAGALIWQLMVQGMEKYADDYVIVPGELPFIDELVKKQSCRLLALQDAKQMRRHKQNVDQICS